MIAGDLAELVQDPPLLRAPRVPVAVIDGLHVLSLGARTHDGFLHRLRKVTSQMARRFSLGNILDGAIRALDSLLKVVLGSGYAFSPVALTLTRGRRAVAWP